MKKKYFYKNIEKQVQSYWYINKIFKAKYDLKKEKYYCLSMFPYPSGYLHIGHIRNYTIGDIIARFNRMLGKNVLYPIGWDAFGLPAENAAIIKNIHPKKWTYKNIYNMRNQIKKLGFSFDWDREIITCDPNYYKWEQLFFKELYKNNIIYRKLSIVNWCENDKTVLANEQVINNKCWRCNIYIKKKKIKQWFIKISNYSDLLLNDLDKLKNWPNKVKLMQEKWIGKIEWYEYNYLFINYFNNKRLILYTNCTNDIKNIKYIIIYKHNIIFNSLNKLDFILIKNLIKKKQIFILDKKSNNKIYIKIYNKKSIFNSINKNNNTNIEKIKKINAYIKNNNIYNNNNINFFKYFIFCIYKKKIINYTNKLFCYKYIFNLQDWCISRQRYWGTPIPVIFNKVNNSISLINNKNIPILLDKEYKYLLKKNEYLETDTLDTFIESSWYHIRFTCPKYKKNFINKKIANYWLPIDQYIGGIEHATMHLLYFRFYHKLLNKFNFINSDEPVDKLLCHGMIMSKSFYYIKDNKIIWVSPSKIKNINGLFVDKYNNKLIFNGITKMSKSKNNGINPNYIIKKYGSDTLRLFIIFSAPVEKDFLWDDTKIIGMYRFLNKAWSISNFITKYKSKIINNKLLNENEFKIYNYFNNEIDNITYLMKNNLFNVVISKIITINNLIYKSLIKSDLNIFFIKKIFIETIKILYPFAPHISFVILKKMKINENIDFCKWPKKFFLV